MRSIALDQHLIAVIKRVMPPVSLTKAGGKIKAEMMLGFYLYDSFGK